MIKNKNKLAIKLFIVVWIVLAIHIALKLTFSYWQPYVIPNDKLKIISDFIDNNNWLEHIISFFFYTFNGIIVILASLQVWWFKNKKQSIIVILLIIASYLLNILLPITTNITPFIITIILPLIINYKKWLNIIINFVLNNVFLILSLWLCELTNLDNSQYIIQVLFVLDYYIMMVLCYFVFNLISKKGKK